MWTKTLPLFVASLLLGSSADAAQFDCEADSECQRLTREGRSAHKEQHDYATAIERFRAAYKRVPDARLLLLIGRSQHKLGAYSLALDYYRRAAPELETQDDLRRLVNFRADAEAALEISAPSAAPPPPVTPEPVPPAPAPRRLSRARLGVGIGLAALAGGALISAAVTNALHHTDAGVGRCPQVGLQAACVYDMTPVFAPAYAAAGTLAIASVLTFTWPNRSAKRERR